VRRSRPVGLQGLLVAVLLAVGCLASLAVLLVVLPTLDSTARRDYAEADARDLAKSIDDFSVGQNFLSEPTMDDLQLIADELARETRAQVRIRYAGALTPIEVVAGGCCELLSTFSQIPAGGSARPLVRRDLAAVAAVGPLSARGNLTGTIEAATTVRRSRANLGPVRQRLFFAVFAVLALAALAGYGLSRLIGLRIARLARTASALAGGDLTARAPHMEPRELATLGDSLNVMAGRLENQVRQITGERDRVRGVVSSLAEGVLGVTPDRRLLLVNAAARRLLGFAEPAPLAHLADLPPVVVEAVEAVLAAGPAASDPDEPWIVVLADGTELELHTAWLADVDAGVVMTMRDVTDERRLDRARRDLVANVSHELKTPLAALKGFIELLQGSRVDAAHREQFLALMSTEADRLERLVEEQLQLARLDSGALPLEREMLDLDALVESVVGSRSPLAAIEGIALHATLPGDPVTVSADGARIEQVLLILIDNALRHTARGGHIDVAVHTSEGRARLSVRDDGEGIPVDEQPYVFDRFYRGDRSREGRSAGLGLAIARGLVHAHGGTIDLVSTPGEGATFTLSLALPAAPTAEMPIVQSPVPETQKHE
jgi:signal transduction histidine kinase